MFLTREQIVLTLLGRAIQGGGLHLADLGENEIRAAFGVAKTFESVSNEMGARPVRSVGTPKRWNECSDDDE